MTVGTVIGNAQTRNVEIVISHGETSAIVATSRSLAAEGAGAVAAIGDPAALPVAVTDATAVDEAGAVSEATEEVAEDLAGEGEALVVVAVDAAVTEEVVVEEVLTGS